MLPIALLRKKKTRFKRSVDIHGDQKKEGVVSILRIIFYNNNKYLFYSFLINGHETRSEVNNTS
jgi:hypothetical protein